MSIFSRTLDKHVPVKKRKVRGNQVSIMNKALPKAIMRRSNLLNKFVNNRTTENWKSYRKQRNKCVKIRNNARREYFKKLDAPHLSNSNFWTTLKPFFSEKSGSRKKPIIIENDVILSDNAAVVFSKHFANITDTLNLPEYISPRDHNPDISDPVLRTIEIYKVHPSIRNIKELTNKLRNKPFELNHVLPWEICKDVHNLKSKKSSIEILVKILKETINSCLPHLTDVLNNSIYDCIWSEDLDILNNSIYDRIWPEDLGMANITPVIKKTNDKGGSLMKENYRLISILPTISKLFERIIARQMNEFMSSKPSSLLCGFRKRYSTQYALLRLIEKWRKCLDISEIITVIQMDLSKAYDCISHDLLIAKLHAYGFGMKSLQFLYNYLTNREHRVKIESTFSDWETFNRGLPQRSVLGPLLFNIFIYDLFMFLDGENLCNFADDNTMFKSCGSLGISKDLVEEQCTLITDWFKFNSMKMNPEKCHVIIIGNEDVPKHFTLNIDNTEKVAEDKLCLLEITIDRKLNFSSHIENLCREASKKLNTLSGIAHHLNGEQVNNIVNVFFYSHFNYCPLIWMFSSKPSNSKLEKIHERSLRIISHNYKSDYNSLLEQSNECTFRVRNLQSLMTEIYKTIADLNPTFIKEFFIRQDTPYRLKRNLRLKIPSVRTLSYGTESISF